MFLHGEFFVFMDSEVPKGVIFTESMRRVIRSVCTKHFDRWKPHPHQRQKDIHKTSNGDDISKLPAIEPKYPQA